MKKSVSLAALFVALPISSAIAADLPSKKEPAVAPVVMPVWAGGYVGLNAGATFANNSAPHAQTWNVAQSASNAGNALTAMLTGSGAGNAGNAGFIGGGQIGYNWQAAYRGYTFITGIEADIQGVAGSGGNASRWTTVNTDYQGQPVTLLSNQKGAANVSYIGTVRGRVGIAVMPTLMIYGTGGLAYGGVNANVQNAQYWVTTGGPKTGYNSVILGGNSYSNTQVGWTAGGGLEWMFMPNWSAKAEYLYYDLGKVSGSAVNNYYGTGGFTGHAGMQNVTNYTARASGNIARLGVNYHLNLASAPVIAKF